jgi:hypothetical protein
LKKKLPEQYFQILIGNPKPYYAQHVARLLSLLNAGWRAIASIDAAE